MTLTVLSVLIHFMILYWINTTGMTRPRVSPNNSSEDQMILSLDCFSLPPTFHRFGTYILPQKGTVLHTLWPDTRFSLHRHSFVPPVSGCSKVLQFRRFLTKLIQSWIATNSFFFSNFNSNAFNQTRICFVIMVIYEWKHMVFNLNRECSKRGSQC